MTKALETQGLRKSFGGVLVIDDLSISVEEGEALGIVGPNGAGKTTWFNLITGAVRADAGRVLFKGTDISRFSKHDRCRIGIGRTFQIPKPFVGMTVFENVLTAATQGRVRGGKELAMRVAQRRSRRFGWRELLFAWHFYPWVWGKLYPIAGKFSEKGSYEKCVECIELAGLRDKMNVLAGSLTLLDRKRLELARALAVNPSVLLLDEIAGGLTEAEVKDLIEEIKSLRATGITIVWIEHIVHALLAVVDRIVVINYGRELCQGDPREVMNSEEVQACYMGGTPA